MKAVQMAKADNVRILLGRRPNTEYQTHTGDNVWSLVEKSNNPEIVDVFQHHRAMLEQQQVAELESPSKVVLSQSDGTGPDEEEGGDM